MIVPPLTMTKRLDSAEARVHHGPPRLTPGTEKPPHEEGVSVAVTVGFEPILGSGRHC